MRTRISRLHEIFNLARAAKPTCIKSKKATTNIQIKNRKIIDLTTTTMNKITSILNLIPITIGSLPRKGDTNITHTFDYIERVDGGYALLFTTRKEKSCFLATNKLKGIITLNLQKP